MSSPDPENDFDALAASMRADASDMRAFVPALAVRLEEAFPGQCVVKRKRKGLFGGGGGEVEAVSVTVGEHIYKLASNAGHVTADRIKSVRGITIKTEQLAVDEWIDQLAAELNEVAQQTEAGRIALQSLLEGDG